MKKHLIIPVLAGSLLLAACGKKEQTAAAPATPPAPAANAVAAFEVTAKDDMKFNLTRLEVKAGQDVKITLTNIGNMPKAAMGHNLVILKKGSDAKAYIDAAVTAMATDYLPAAQADQVLIATKLLGPKQSDTISFKAPTEPGEYPFVCTFPAHYLSGMKGVLVVN
jgi:azurin